MSHTVHRATRVMLLVVATGGFIAVWSGDRPPQGPARPAEQTASADCGVPLPAKLTPGEYRVVNGRGEVRSVAFTAADLACNGIAEPAAPRNLYVREMGSERWYFIRVDGTATQTMAVQESKTPATRFVQLACKTERSKTEK